MKSVIFYFAMAILCVKNKILLLILLKIAISLYYEFITALLLFVMKNFTPALLFSITLLLVLCKITAPRYYSTLRFY